MWQVPTQVAVTAALAAGGTIIPPGGLIAGATPFDEPTLRTGLVVPPGGSLSIPIPAIAAGRTGSVTAIGLDTSDIANTRVSTRVNGVAVPPEIGTVGTIGAATSPTILPVPIALAAGDVFDLFVEDLSGAGLTINAVRILGVR